MGRVFCNISMSLDGYVAGPNASLERPLGEGGERLHEWAFKLASFRERHGIEGGETNRDSQLVQKTLDATGAVVMGRRMFSGGEGRGRTTRTPTGGGGRPSLPRTGVRPHPPRPRDRDQAGRDHLHIRHGGIETALEQAGAAAGEKDVQVGGGANAVQQCLEAGLLDELQIHLVPMFLGSGVRLFEGAGRQPVALQLTRVVDSPAVTHLRYRIVKQSG
jgi:dihydrofolate reductase